MKAIVMTTPGGVDVLTLEDVPKPTIEQPYEVLVRLHAAGVNPIDTKLRAGGPFLSEQSPTILGCDGAGVVEQVGSAVQGFQPGDAVYFCQGGLGGPRGNYAEWAVVDSRFIARKPTSLSFMEAAAAPLVLITAWESLYDRARLKADQSVLIHAGAGGVGQAAIQLAKLRKAKICTTVSSPEKAELVKGLGADHIIDYKQTDVVESVLAWSDGQGVNVAFDTVGDDVFIQSIPAVRIYGDLVTILQIPDQVDWQVARMRNLRISQEVMLTPMLGNSVTHQVHHRDILTQCAEWFDSGQLRIKVQESFPLAGTNKAHRLLEDGGMMGKLVLEIDHT